MAFSGTTTLSGAPTFSIAPGAQLTLGAVTNGANTITLTGGGNFAQAGFINNGSGGLTLNSNFTGVATLSQPNNYTGATLIQNGTLALGATNSLPTASKLTFGSSVPTAGKLDLAGHSQTVGGLAVATGAAAYAQIIGNSSASTPSVLTFTNTTTASTFGGTIQDTLFGGGSTTGLTVSAGSNLTLSGANTYTGPTSVSGTLAVTGALGDTAVTVNTGGTLQGGGSISGSVGVSSTGTIQPHIGSTVGTPMFGSLTLSGGAILSMTLGTASDLITVANTASLSGSQTITITGGSGFAATSSYKLIDAGALSVAVGTTFAVNSPPGYYCSVTYPANALLLGVQQYNLTWAGGAPTWSTSTGDTNWTGPTTYFANAAIVTFDNNATGTKTVNVSGTVLPQSVTVTTASPNVYTFGGTGVIGNSTLGATKITKNGTGTLIINNGANTYTGGVALNGGTLQINADTSLGAVPATATTNLTFGGSVTLQAGASVNLNANRNIAISGAYTATFDTNGNNMTIGGVISGASATGLAKIGSGNLTLSNTNTYAGPTTISAGTLTVTNPGALSSGTVVLNGTAPTLRLSATSTAITGISAAQWTLNHSGTFTPTITSGTLQMTSAAGTEYTSAWYNTPVNLISGFTAQFTYQETGTSPANGLTFTFQNAGTSALSTNDGGSGLGYSGIATSAALELSIYSGDGVGISAGSNGTITTKSSTSPVNLASQDPILITVTGSSGSANLAVTLKDTTTSATYSTTLTLSNTLAALLGSNSAYAGFTAATGAVYAAQSVSGFSLAVNSFSTGNNVSVQADSTIDVSIPGGSATMGTLAIGSNTLSITNTSGGGATLILGAATLSGNPIFSPATGVTVALGALNDGSAPGNPMPRTITVNGTTTGTVVLGTAATSLVAGTIFAVQSGVLGSTNATALGSVAIVNVNDGATFSVGASQTIAALGDYAASPTGTASVTLNGNTLTVGEGAGNLSTTYTGHISDGTAAGSLVKAGTGTLTLDGTSTYSGGTTIQAGKVVLGVGNALPTTGTLTFGPASATLDLNGHSQQVGGLAVTGGSAVIGNSSTSASAQLTYLGGASTFGGMIQDMLSSGTKQIAVGVNGGTLTLSGSNTYSGGTIISTGGTLAVANSTGSATGSGQVIVSGTLAGSGAILPGANGVLVNASGTLAPHLNLTTPGSIAIGASSSLSLSSGATLNYLFGAPSYTGDIPDGSNNDNVQINGDLILNGSINLNINALGAFSDGSYEILGYTDNLTDNAAFNITNGSLRYNYFVRKPGDTGGFANELVLEVDLKPTLYWTGSSSANWSQLPLDKNWTLTGVGSPGTDVTYPDYAPVAFGDTAFGNAVANTNITLTGTVNPPTVVFSNNSVHYTISGGNIAGTGTVTMNGTGTVTLTGTNSYTGGTTITSGTIQINNPAALGDPSSALALGAGTLEVQATFSSARSITLGDGTSAIAVDGGITYTNTGVISGTNLGYNLNATGQGTLALTGNNTFHGQTIIQSGTVSVATLAAAGTPQPLGMNPNPVVIGTANASTAALAYTGAGASTNIPVAIGSGGGKISVAGGATLTLSGVISGGALTTAGAGTLSLAGANNYSGSTSVSGGTLTVTSPGSLPNIPLSIASGATVQLRPPVGGPANPQPGECRGKFARKCWLSGRRRL